MNRAIVIFFSLFIFAGCASIDNAPPPNALSAAHTFFQEDGETDTNEFKKISAAEPTAEPEPEPTTEPEPTAEPEPEPEPIPLVEYSGPLYHVFYHFLIAFPDIAYSNPYGNDMDIVCVTPTEFRRSLEELHKNDFVLVDINKYVSVDETGGISKAAIMVPEGKKPLVMSFDDINYYSRNHGLGICDKIILDENGKFAMYTLMSDGTESITYDNGVVPILEKFCEEYPDFTPFGDKGLLAVTGYDGVLGYRIQRDHPDREAEIEAAKPVVAALKEAGWQFASHSYGHIHSKTVGIETVKADTFNWDDEIAPIVGDTQIYVFPYGEYTTHSEPEFRHIVDSGFKIICGVGLAPYFKEYENYVFMDRTFIDGTSLRECQKYLDPLMDSNIVLCPEERRVSDKAG